MARTKLSSVLTGSAALPATGLGPKYAVTTNNLDLMVAKADEHDDALDALEATGLAWFLPDVANTFDPTVAPGLAGREGARVGTVNKLIAWEHGTPVTDALTPDTNWYRIGKGS